MTLGDVQRAICIAAHPDDEILGAGATLATLADRGCEVHVLVLGEGVGARFAANERPEEDVLALSEQVREAASILGAIPHQLNLPDNRFDSLDMLDVVHAVEAKKQEIRPDLVFTHHPGDMNIDHRVTANAVLTAFRPIPGEQGCMIFSFETLSSTEWNPSPNGVPFMPNWFEDASPGLERKVQAMAVYESELRDWPHPRSLEGIRVAARRWGMTVGLNAAEPFMLLRYVSGPAGLSRTRKDAAEAGLELRPAGPADEQRLLDWRNDPTVRRFAFRQEVIAADTHHAWFAGKLADPACTIFIIEEDGRPVGQVRLERKNGEAVEIAIAVASEARDRGIARRTLRLGIEYARHSSDASVVRALVKPDNEPSLRAFRAAGFREQARTPEAIELVWPLRE